MEYRPPIVSYGELTAVIGKPLSGKTSIVRDLTSFHPTRWISHGPLVPLSCLYEDTRPTDVIVIDRHVDPKALPRLRAIAKNTGAAIIVICSAAKDSIEPSFDNIWMVERAGGESHVSALKRSRGDALPIAVFDLSSRWIAPPWENA